MSGQPVKTPSDVDKFRKAYMASLQLQIQNDDKNLQANKLHKRTGAVATQITDYRSTTEKLADLAYLRILVKKELQRLADPTESEIISQKLTADQVRFVAQNIELLVKEIVPRHKLGITADIFIQFVNRLMSTSAVAPSATPPPAPSAPQADKPFPSVPTQRPALNAVPAETPRIDIDYTSLNCPLTEDVVRGVVDYFKQYSDKFNPALLDRLFQNLSLIEGFIPSDRVVDLVMSEGDPFTRSHIIGLMNSAFSHFPNAEMFRQRITQIGGVPSNIGKNDLLAKLIDLTTLPPEMEAINDEVQAYIRMKDAEDERRINEGFEIDPRRLGERKLEREEYPKIPQGVKEGIRLRKEKADLAKAESVLATQRKGAERRGNLIANLRGQAEARKAKKPLPSLDDLEEELEERQLRQSAITGRRRELLADVKNRPRILLEDAVELRQEAIRLGLRQDEYEAVLATFEPTSSKDDVITGMREFMEFKQLGRSSLTYKPPEIDYSKGVFIPEENLPNATRTEILGSLNGWARLGVGEKVQLGRKTKGQLIAIYRERTPEILEALRRPASNPFSAYDQAMSGSNPPPSRLPTVTSDRRGEGRGIKGKGFTVAEDKGVKSEKFASLGRYFINLPKLNDDIIVLARDTGKNVADWKTKRVSVEVANVVRKVVNGGKPSYDDIHKLSDDDKAVLNNLFRMAQIVGEGLEIPRPTNEMADINRFNVLKGEILSGNDGKETVKEFKVLIMKMMNSGHLPKGQAKELLLELTQLGY
jgi:hypothetical protein